MILVSEFSLYSSFFIAIFCGECSDRYFLSFGATQRPKRNTPEVGYIKQEEPQIRENEHFIRKTIHELKKTHLIKALFI